MCDETTKYRLSLYESQELIKETPTCRIETVFCTLDDTIYVMRTYPDDKREIFSALMGLQIAHIPKITEVIFSDNTVVIEEYIQGERLSTLIENSQLTRRQTQAWTKQIFETLEALHAQNIIHRDIKTDNIVVDKNDCLYLIDFGIARFYDKTASGDTQHFGTIGYAPPEQFGFSQSDFRSDLYAAGVTIEKMCKKARCLSCSVIMKTARKCQELDPNRRYPSAAAALRGLRVRQWQLNMAVATVLLLAIVAAAFVLQVAELDGDVNRDGIGWKPIIAVSTVESAKEIPYIPILADTALTSKKISLTDRQPEIELQYKLKNGILDLTLSAYALSEPKAFSFEYPKTQQNAGEGKKIEAEIMFYDMNGDGQHELLIALSLRERFELPTGDIFEDTSGIVLWCVGYLENEDFWQADGMVGPSVRLELGNGILTDGMTGEVIFLVDRSWTRH